MKKWLILILPLCLLAALMTPGLAADDTSDDTAGGSSDTAEPEPVTYLDSGFLNRPKLTPLEMQRLLNDSPTEMPDENAIYDRKPSFIVPFQEGRVRASLLQQAADRLSVLRNLAGLPEVTLDGGLCERSQYGAVLLGTEGVSFGYEPEKPAGMETAFYNVAKEAIQASSLNAGIPLLDVPETFMDDSDADNVSVLGHRRFQLYPALKKVGFGYVDDSPNFYGKYTVENIFDYSGAVSDYHFISWPASGSFPADLFSSDTAWSVTLNPREYTIPAQVNVTVTLTRESDGQTWILPGNRTYTPADTGEYMHLDTTNYGVANCIIFRPAGVNYYAGTYTVSIGGLLDRSGQSVKFAFRVDFFDLTSQSEGITSVTTSLFSDTALNVSVTAYISEPGRYQLVVAAYDQYGRIAAIGARSVNLTDEQKSYTLMLEPCVNAQRVKAFLMDGRGKPVSLAIGKTIVP